MGSNCFASLLFCQGQRLGRRKHSLQICDIPLPLFNASAAACAPVPVQLVAGHSIDHPPTTLYVLREKTPQVEIYKVPLLMFFKGPRVVTDPHEPSCQLRHFTVARTFLSSTRLLGSGCLPSHCDLRGEGARTGAVGGAWSVR